MVTNEIYHQNDHSRNGGGQMYIYAFCQIAVLQIQKFEKDVSFLILTTILESRFKL